MQKGQVQTLTWAILWRVTLPSGLDMRNDKRRRLQSSRLNSGRAKQRFTRFIQQSPVSRDSMSFIPQRTRILGGDTALVVTFVPNRPSADMQGLSCICFGVCPSSVAFHRQNPGNLSRSFPSMCSLGSNVSRTGPCSSLTGCVVRTDWRRTRRGSGFCACGCSKRRRLTRRSLFWGTIGPGVVIRNSVY